MKKITPIDISFSLFPFPSFPLYFLQYFQHNILCHSANLTLRHLVFNLGVLLVRFFVGQLGKPFQFTRGKERNREGETGDLLSALFSNFNL